jgi:hypothetical protein
MKKESKGSLIIHGDGEVPYSPGSFCAGCSGVYAVPLPTTDISFVRAYIHKEDGANVETVVMHDYNGDGRYEGEWQTYSAEDGTYHIVIEATDGELKTKSSSAASQQLRYASPYVNCRRTLQQSDPPWPLAQPEIRGRPQKLVPQ